MRGEILHYDVEQGIGFISADDGSRYMFSRGDLMQAQRVGKGTKIDFRPEGQNAREVYVLDPRAPSAPASRTASASVPAIGQTGGDTAIQGTAPIQIPPSAQSPYARFPTSAPDMGVWGYFMHCVTKGYADFRGRARRKEYWGFAPFYTMAIIAVVLIGLAIDGAIGNLDDGAPIATAILGGLAVLFFFMPTMAVNVRRFHDVGLSGWLYLLFIVLSFLYIGGIIIFVISLLPSQKHDNKWGPVPDGIRV